MLRNVVLGVACLLSGGGSQLMAQGVLISSGSQPAFLPRWTVRPPASIPMLTYKIKELAVQARIIDQIARVQMTQTFVNTGNAPMEVSYCFPLPYDGAIDQMTFMVDGKEFQAKLLPAQQAREIYEGYVRRSQDPGLLEWIGTGMFRTSVFPVPAGAQRTVTINFSQLLRQSDHLTDFLYPLSTAKFTSQPIEKITFTASIETSAKIKSVYSPSHAVDVKRSDDHHAVASMEALNVIPSSDFRLFFDTAQQELGASLISYRPDAKEDGYFVLLASPEVKQSSIPLPPKTILFALDRSGSMSGKKIDQAKEALRFVLNNLREGDLFNIVVYDSVVESFRPELQKFDDATRKSALGYVEGIYAGGGTNISQALTTALKMIQDAGRPSYLVFLTDGLPTAGETNEMKICELARQSNEYRARIVSFGVGYDVNSRLLDRISRDNHGHSELVRPNEDIEQHVSRLYQRISLPVITDVRLTVELQGAITEQGAAINRVYPRQLLDLFAGDQLVVVGRYQKAGAATVTVSGSVGDQQSKLEFPASLAQASSDQNFGFVEKLWAIRRIGEIIDELDLKGQNAELVQELVALSTKHGILTPYTSFLADETSSISDLANTSGNVSRTQFNLQQLAEVQGQSGFDQRAAKNSMRAAAQSSLGGGFARESLGSQPAGQAAGMKTVWNNLYSAADAQGQSSGSLEITAGVSVQNVGNQTLYKRGNIWVAENAKDVDLEKDSGKIQEVERFSDAYFQLVASNTAAENAVLAIQSSGEELLVNFRGQHYRIR